jgi:cytochrome c biogenesis protein CcmG/thiol:disulfide interchange protein DsbE
MSRQPTPAPAGSRTVAFVVGGIILVSVLALVAIVATSGSDDDADQAGLTQQGEVEVQGPGLPAHGGEPDAAVGATIPTVVGQSFDGSPVTIAADAGPQLLVFLAHWCPHCQAEVPGLVEQMAGGTTIAGTEVIGVATGTDESAPNYPPSAWLESEGWSAPVLADDVGGHTSEAFGLSGFPYFVAVTADGTVAARSSGELTQDEVTALALAAQGS